MADKKTTRKPRKARDSQFYLAKVSGEEKPRIIIAKNYKAALASIVQLSVATARNLLEAGESGYKVNDATGFDNESGLAAAG